MKGMVAAIKAAMCPVMVPGTWGNNSGAHCDAPGSLPTAHTPMPAAVQKTTCCTFCLQFFLSNERLTAAQVAYDRPSPKLISFLRRHYGGHQITDVHSAL